MAKRNVEIIEEPAEKSFRFRYESEGRNSGSILGVNSTHNNPTYPKIRVHNYTGDVLVVISCVTNESKPRQHPHKVSTKSSPCVTDDGIYAKNFTIDRHSVIEFKDIGIVFVKKENIQKSLQQRRRRNNDPTSGAYGRYDRYDPTNGGWNHMDKPQLIDLHCVRLCFHVIGKKPGSDEFNSNIGVVVTKKILDKKSHGLLKIVELSSTVSQAHGGDKILIFCDRVKREDIAIVFYEEEQTPNGPKRVWECELNYKNCKSMLIHHQFGIKITTPSYKDPNIREARQTFIQLRRPSDDECSKPLPFEFVPNDQITKSIHLLNGKRKKCKKMNDTVAPLLAHIANQVKKNDTKQKSTKNMPSVYDTVLSKVQSIVNEQRLIDYSDDDGKENNFASYQMQNQMPLNVNPIDNRPLEMQYGHCASNNVAQSSYNRTAATYCPPSTQPSPYVNDRFDHHLINAQSYTPMNMYQPPQTPHHHHHHNHLQREQQQQQQQSHTGINNANAYAAGIQNMMYPVMNPITNNMPLANNHFNIPPNHQNHATSNHTYPTMDANIDSNLPNLNLSDFLPNNIINMNNTSEIDVAILSRDMDSQLSME